MSIIDTLITDRTEADVQRWSSLKAKGWAGMTNAEKAEWAASLKGSYNYTDLNRVTEAMDYLNERLAGYGYQTGYQKVEVPHQKEPVSPLPDGYTQLAWIESSGTQYINTGYKPSSQTQLVMTISDFAGGVWKNFYGVRTTASSTDSKQFALGATSPATTLRCDYFGSNATMTVAEYTGKTIINHDKETLTAYGQSISNPVSSEAAGNLELILFGFNSAGSIANLATFKLYSCQIYDNGTLVRDFVPCTNPSEIAGLYDLVNGVFYGNAGTGTFTDGPEVEAPGEPTEELDPYTWYEPDIPTPELMTAYLSNVQAIRSTLEVLSATPETPESMEALTWVEANNIEQILVDVETAINRVVNAMARSNSFTFWSGNLPIPTAKSNLGRNWAELDAMDTTWANWQVATWYLLLYGNLEAEGVVT